MLMEQPHPPTPSLCALKALDQAVGAAAPPLALRVAAELGAVEWEAKKAVMSKRERKKAEEEARQERRRQKHARRRHRHEALDLPSVAPAPDMPSPTMRWRRLRVLKIFGPSDTESGEDTDASSRRNENAALPPEAETSAASPVRTSLKSRAPTSRAAAT